MMLLMCIWFWSQHSIPQDGLVEDHQEQTKSQLVYHESLNRLACVCAQGEIETTEPIPSQDAKESGAVSGDTRNEVSQVQGSGNGASQTKDDTTEDHATPISPVRGSCCVAGVLLPEASHPEHVAKSSPQTEGGITEITQDLVSPASRGFIPFPTSSAELIAAG